MPAWSDNIDTLKDDVMREMHRPVESAPADPTAITGATAKMLGLAVLFTPRRTRRALVLVKGNITCNTTAGITTVQLKRGTGAAPANDAADTGTQIGVDSTFTALTGMLTVPFADVAIADNLTMGTQYWFDYNAKTGDGAHTGRVLDVNIVILEV